MRSTSCALVVAIVAIVSGCGGSSAPAGARVLVVGDSITAMSREPITTALERNGWLPTVEALGGTDIAFWRHRAATFVRAVDPQAVVVELGTNQRGGEQQVRRVVDAVMRGLRRVTTVYWLNVQEGKRIGARSVPPNPAAVNRALETAQLRWENLQVLDLNGYFADHPAWHAPDGVHPNAEGQRAIGRFVADNLGRADGDRSARPMVSE